MYLIDVSRGKGMENEEYIPSWRFGTKVDLKADDEGWYRSATQHPPPRRILTKELDVLESNRHDETQHDAKSSPHLPHHCKGTTNILWCRFCRVDGSRGRFRTHSESEEEARNQEVRPTVRCSHPDSRDERYDARNEDGSAATEELVERCVGPAAEKGGAEVRSAVEQTLEPYIGDAEFAKVKELVAF